MSFVNTTGRRRTQDLTLGGGSLYIALLDTTTGLEDDAGFRDADNVTEFTLTIDIEELEHQSTEFGVRSTDKKIVLQRELTFGFTLDKISAQNLALWALGGTSTLVNPAVVGFSAQVVTDSAELGRWYNIRDGSGNPVGDIETANVTIRRDPSGTPVTLVDGTDYLLDENHGRFFVLTGGAVVQGDEIDVALAADAGAVANLDLVEAFTSTSTQRYVIEFHQHDGCEGTVARYIIHSCTIQPDGDAGLVAEEFQTLSFTGTGEAESVATGSPRTLTIIDHDNSDI